MEKYKDYLSVLVTLAWFRYGDEITLYTVIVCVLCELNRRVIKCAELNVAR